MLNYSELSKPQKAVIDGMRQGGIFIYNRSTNQFSLNDERGFTMRVKNATGNSLFLRHFITQSRIIGDRTIYILSPHIT
jgi:hypothetical protein